MGLDRRNGRRGVVDLGKRVGSRGDCGVRYKGLVGLGSRGVVELGSRGVVGFRIGVIVGLGSKE